MNIEFIIINNVADINASRNVLQDEFNYFSCLQFEAIKKNNFDLLNSANEGLQICRLKLLKFRNIKKDFAKFMQKEISFLN